MAYGTEAKVAGSPAERNDPSAPTTLLISAAEAAQRLGISERKLWDLTKSGEIVCVRLGRSVRYSVRYLEHWALERSGVESPKH